MGFDEISVTLPTFNGIAIRSVSGRHFGKLTDSNVSWIQPVDATSWLNRSAGVS